MTRLISIPIIVILLIFNIRRLVLTLAVIFPNRRKEEHHQILINQPYLPTILILIPCHNEVEMIPGLCRALAKIDYPAEMYKVILIDDGSIDGTCEAMERQAIDREGWKILMLPFNVGKASALNVALAQNPFGEIVYIFDADYRPEPDALKRAVQYFQDPRVAGVSGRSIPDNPLASPAAYYSAVESQIHQMIVMRGKDRLRLAPALLGSNCGYRRRILAKCAYFRDGELLEDFDLTLSFYRAGYSIRFVEDAVARHQVPESVRGYLTQHIRWARGFTDVANRHKIGLLKDRNLPLPLRVDLLLFSAGYLDRIALTGAVIFTILASLGVTVFRFPWQVLSFALITPLVQISTLFIEQKMPIAMWIRLPIIPLFYALDIITSVKGFIDSVFHRQKHWTKTERSMTFD